MPEARQSGQFQVMEKPAWVLWMPILYLVSPTASSSITTPGVEDDLDSMEPNECF